MPDTNNKGDFVDRKVEGAVKIFGMAEKNVLALMLVFMILLNAWIFNLYTEAKDETIKVNNDLTQQVIQEVRRQVPGAVKKEVKEQVQPIAESVDTAKNNLERIIERISP